MLTWVRDLLSLEIPPDKRGGSVERIRMIGWLWWLSLSAPAFSSQGCWWSSSEEPKTAPEESFESVQWRQIAVVLGKGKRSVLECTQRLRDEPCHCRQPQNSTHYRLPIDSHCSVGNLNSWKLFIGSWRVGVHAELGNNLHCPNELPGIGVATPGNATINNFLKIKEKLIKI